MRGGRWWSCRDVNEREIDLDALTWACMNEMNWDELE
jgi:hypothetical protein